MTSTNIITVSNKDGKLWEGKDDGKLGEAKDDGATTPARGGRRW